MHMLFTIVYGIVYGWIFYIIAHLLGLDLRYGSRSWYEIPLLATLIGTYVILVALSGLLTAQYLERKFNGKSD